MFKRHTESIPLPINNLLTKNNAQYTYFSRQINSLHTQIGKNVKVYKLFSFYGINTWNHMSRKIPTNVSYVYYKKISQRDIQYNTIPYRII